MQQAREFLSRVLPWPPSGTPGSYMNIHWSYTKAGVDKPLWFGIACTSVDEAVSTVRRAVNKADTLGVYVCMSSQRTAQLKVSNAGNNYLAAQRAAQNAVEHKSFYIDIDVKEGAYGSTGDALAALNQFLIDSGLPIPTAVVGTGSGGLHCHWVVERPIPTQEWKPYAMALATAVTQLGLIADTQCTIDAARILRVPDTFNKKSGAPLPVALMCQMVGSDYPNDLIYKALTPFRDMRGGSSQNQGVQSLPSAFVGMGGVHSTVVPIDSLSAGVSREARPVILEDVARECAFVGDALRDGGKNYSNPLWNLTTLLATFTEDGRDNAHNMAKAHAGYTSESTDALFTRKLQERANNNIGWPQCRTIANSGCASCSTCPHFGAGKSPLHFGRSSSQPAPNASGLPGMYFRDAGGLVYLNRTKEDGTAIAQLVSPYTIQDGWIQDRPWTLFFNTELTKQHKKQIRLPFEVIDRKDAMIKTLGEQGFALKNKDAAGLGEFLMSWIQELRKVKSSVISASPFGWLIENGKEAGFTYGGKVFCPNGIERPSSNPDPNLAEQYSPKGDIDPWRKAVKMITDQQRPELNAIIACAFAAPLVRFTGQSGALVSAYSSASGIGKTSAMRVAMAVWGDPIRASQTLDDTNASVINKAGELRSLPLFWDELKTEDDVSKFVKLAFQITSGKEKSRMTSNVTQRHVGTWETMVTVASNDTLVDEIIKVTKQTAAGLYRLFEYEVAPGIIGQISHSEASRVVHGTYDNYGHAGYAYAKYLGANHASVRAQVARTMDSFEAACKGQADERFWFACAGTIFLGAFYSNNLGLTDIDLASLKKFLFDTIEHMRMLRRQHGSDITNTANVEDIFTSFMSSHMARHTLWTDTMPLGPGKPAKPKIIRDISKLDGVYIHIAVNTGVMRISSTRLSEWLRDRGYSRTMFVNELKQKFGFKEQPSATLGGGTEFVTGKQYCLEIMFAGTPMQDFINSSSGAST